MPYSCAIMSHNDAVSRFIPAPPMKLYEAFTTAEAIVQWLPPKGMVGQMLHFDFREGGMYRLRLTYSNPRLDAGKTDQDSDVSEVFIRKLEQARRIEQEIKFDSDDHRFSDTMRMTWIFEPEREGTLVTICAEGVPDAIRREDHIAGFNSSLDNLARFVGRGADVLS